MRLCIFLKNHLIASKWCTDHVLCIMLLTLTKGEVIKAGSILGGRKGKNESTSPERGDPPDSSTQTTEPLNTRKRRSPPSNGISEAAKDRKYVCLCTTNEFATLSSHPQTHARTLFPHCPFITFHFPSLFYCFCIILYSSWSRVRRREKETRFSESIGRIKPIQKFHHSETQNRSNTEILGTSRAVQDERPTYCIDKSSYSK